MDYAVGLFQGIGPRKACFLQDTRDAAEKADDHTNAFCGHGALAGTIHFLPAWNSVIVACPLAWYYALWGIVFQGFRSMCH